MKAGDLVTLFEQEGYYMLVERDKAHWNDFGNRWWKMMKLSGESLEYIDYCWKTETLMELVSETG
tara:strand:+ start:346 stop:540 length:195 start_codon:yes stop_codon:yes gene_type:complete